MRLSNFREAPLIRASLLINQEKPKKGNKKDEINKMSDEINKMSEVFGKDFDKDLHKILFEDIDFREIKNNKSGKAQFFIQDFPQFIERSDFIKIFSEILMDTETQSTFQEIYTGLNKIVKLSYENQFKIIISFILSGNEQFVQDAQKMLLNKCQEIQKDQKERNQKDQLSQSTIQSLMLILGTFDENLTGSIDLVNFIESNSSQDCDDIKKISDIENLLKTGIDDTIEAEKIISEIGPLNVNNNSLKFQNCEMINCELNEKRLAWFILFLLKHQNCVVDKENRHLNQIFMKSIGIDTNSTQELSEAKTNMTWSIDNFYKMFQKSIDKMDRPQVFNAFDDPKFSIKDKPTFDFFIKILQKLNILTKPIQFFEFIFTKWNNELNQIEFLSFLIDNNQQLDAYSFKNIDDFKDKKNPEILSLSSHLKSSNLVEVWSCAHLIEVLLKLSKGNYYIKVKELFKWPIENIPEILILVLTSITPEKDDFLYYELIQEILPNFLANHQVPSSLIDEIWSNNKDLIIQTLCNMYEASPDLMNLSRILDITQKLKDSLLLLVNCKDYNFSVNLGILSAKRDFLHLEQWLKDRISKSGDEFIDALLNYIKQNLISHCKGSSTNKENVLEKAQLTLESLAMILENLIGATTNPKVSQRIKSEIREVYKSIFEIFDELQSQPVNSEEIEKAADATFKSLFKGEISVNELIEKLIHYQNSNIPRETELFACIIHCILDEYRFFHQYPERQLSIASTLFGQLINNKLIEGVIETIALKYILEGLKKGTGTMFLFGTIALNQFIDKIQSLPTYLSLLIEVKQIKNSPPLYDKLIKKYNESVNNTTTKSPFMITNELSKDIFGNDEKDMKIGNNAFTGELKNEKVKTKLVRPRSDSVDIISILFDNEKDNSIIPPKQETINNMKFIFNSISKSNVKEKSNELKSLLNSENTIKWFSNNFVKYRISAESKFHQNYNELITEMNSKELNKLLIKDTIFYIKKLLSHEGLEKDAKEKNVLKNLGSWLGLMTLSKNKPILAKDLDLKELIFEAYEKGKLGPIVTFVTKILERSAKTKVFHPNNPWIQAILTLLSELYSKPNLKQGIKTEIQLLFKTIEASMNNFPPGKLLDNYTVASNSQDFIKSQPQQSSSQITEVFDHELFPKVSNLTKYINDILEVLQKTNISLTYQDIARFLTKNLYTSINESSTTIERAINVSLCSTRELIIKDFMLDNDENKFKYAEIACVKTLSSSLAINLCRQPLQEKVTERLKDLLSEKGFSKAVVDSIVEIPNTEYLEIGNWIIHKHITRKAIEQVQKDQKLNEEIDRRKVNKNNEKVKNEFLSKINNLPERIKPNQNGLTEEQFEIYQNFEKIYQLNNIYEKSAKVSFLNKIIMMVQEILKTDNINSPKILKKKYEMFMVNIQNISQDEKHSFDDNDQELLCLEKPLFESNIKDYSLAAELALVSLRYAINSSRKNSNLLLSIYSQLIKGWIKLHEDISKDITEALLTNIKIYVRFKFDIHYTFLKKEIFSIPEYENYFLKFLENESTCEVARNLLNKLNQKGAIPFGLFKQIPSYMYNKYSESYFALFKVHSKIASIFDKKDQFSYDCKINCAKNQSDIQKFCNNCLYCFHAINELKLSGYKSKDEKKFKEAKEFIDEHLDDFVYVITDFCIRGSTEGVKDLDIKFSPTVDPTKEASFLFDLIFSPYLSGNFDKLQRFSIILSNIVKSFHYDYLKQKEAFNQRPYYKLLYNLLSQIAAIDSDWSKYDQKNKKILYLAEISKLFEVLSPQNYPGFSFAWLDLMSCNKIVSSFLDVNLKKIKNEDLVKIQKYSTQVVDLLKYISTMTEDAVLDFTSKIFLDNIYRFMFLLCNSYPNLISSYYFIILISFPPGNCFLQLKNLILSCCPREVELPDPLTEEIKDVFASKRNAEILFEAHRIVNEATFKISSDSESTFKISIDNYVESKNDSLIDAIIKDLNSKKHNKELNFYKISGIVIYWSQKILKNIIEKKNNSNYFVFDFFMKLMQNFEFENRDHLINAILNELRYPSNQTYYFGYLLIFIFVGIQNEEIEEHILRSMVERLLFKPHPWGLELTFLNLMKNQKYMEMPKPYINQSISEELLDRLLSNCKDKKLVNYVSN